MSKKIPTPDNIVRTDDGALGFEWYGADCRVGLFFEQNPSESGWHYVSKFSIGGEMFCEELSKMDVNKLIKYIWKTKERKMENDKYRFRIDLKKWKATVSEVVAARETRRNEFGKNIEDYCAKTEGKNGVPILPRQGFNDYMDIGYAEALTKLYSIRAHARGRLHRKYVKLNYSDWRKLPSAGSLPVREMRYDQFTQASGKLRFELTMEDQTAYIGSDWKAYEYNDTPKEEVIVEQPKNEVTKNKWWHIWKKEA